MPLNYNDLYDSPSIDINLPDPITAENVNSQTQPTAKQNASSGFSLNDALKNVLGLLDNGLAIYDSINNKIGGAAEKTAESQQQPKQVVVSAAQPAFVFGLSTNQLLLIAGGLAALLILPRVLKKA